MTKNEMSSKEKDLIKLSNIKKIIEIMEKDILESVNYMNKVDTQDWQDYITDKSNFTLSKKEIKFISNFMIAK